MSLDQRNAEFEQKVEDSDPHKAIETLIKDASRSRRRFKLLVLTVVFDVLLTAGFGYITIRTHNLANQAENNATAIVRACETTNDARANNKLLWDYILEQPPRAERTPEQVQRLAEFQAFVDKTFAPRDCSVAQ